MSWQQLNKSLGALELFLIDQLLKGKFPEKSRILDAGCGEGRNLYYFLQHPYYITAIDTYPPAIRMLQMVAEGMKDKKKASLHTEICELKEVPLPASSFESIFSISVLHTLKDMEEVDLAFAEMNRLLVSGGRIFLQTAAIENADRLKVDDESGINLRISLDQIEHLMDKYQLAHEEVPRQVIIQGYLSVHQLVLQKTTP